VKDLFFRSYGYRRMNTVKISKKRTAIRIMYIMSLLIEILDLKGVSLSIIN